MQTKTERNLNEIFDVDPIPEEAKSDLVPMDEEVPNYRPSNFNPNRIEEQENEELKTEVEKLPFIISSPPLLAHENKNTRDLCGCSCFRV